MTTTNVIEIGKDISNISSEVFAETVRWGITGSIAAIAVLTILIVAAIIWWRIGKDKPWFDGLEPAPVLLLILLGVLLMIPIRNLLKIAVAPKAYVAEQILK